MAKLAEKIFSLVKPTVEQQGVNLWDVRFVKEGASYYLRIFIDKEGGVNIDDCTNVSHAVDPILDEEDPIDGAYYLEVCSAGLERELSRPEHFERFIGSKITVKLYRGYEGSKQHKGILLSYDGGLTLEMGEKQVYFEKKDISGVYLDDTDILGGITENE